MVAKLYKNTSEAVSITISDTKATCRMGYFVLYTIFLATILFIISS